MKINIKKVILLVLAVLAFNKSNLYGGLAGVIYAPEPENLAEVTPEEQADYEKTPTEPMTRYELDQYYQKYIDDKTAKIAQLTNDLAFETETLKTALAEDPVNHLAVTNQSKKINNIQSQLSQLRAQRSNWIIKKRKERALETVN